MGAGAVRAAIITNPMKDQGYEVSRRAVGVLMDAGVTVCALPEACAALPEGVQTALLPELYACDFIVTLGGDGTILAAAREAAEASPVLGINLGRKGFLTEVEVGDLDEALRCAAAGRYTVERRLMLQAVVFDETGVERCRTLALNDMYASGTVARLVHLEVRIRGRVVGRYAADGVLVASPTGSTGYSLSAGGPVVSPDVPCMLITPVCAHSLRAVPVVISAEETVVLRTDGPTREVRLSADGEESIRVREGWRIEVSRAGRDARFIRLGQRDFYGLLRDKFTEWNS